ncbi:class I SAM-dependent methyltransferase [Microbacterium rhizomatis]|uniref:Class I SAM-dependent methyltransferase n=1 Tax=Microbacterium rhizomatis TaxID=1631477 RepID=A0A5J5J223_9MICO|nr:class I SAM-dependent methyltransferase [Microbacterium rhizomatis]KAA9110151.1 class I SAM-dependent methyltransferase [Microbacterium rhizomatis]
MNDPADFDGVAALYAVARPTYPKAAVDWLVDADASVVVDVGAGTGLFTRLLDDGARTVIAVEPSARMLEQLRLAVPGVRAVTGSGERMPLPDASADAVVFAQAWHWVDLPAASIEAARVLRPGGRLGLVWNLRDERVAWVRELGAAMRADGDHFRGQPQDPEVGPPFSAPERSLVEWVRVCSPDEIVSDVRSRSYFELLSATEQRAVEGDVRAVLDRHPETAGRTSIELPYVTASFRYVRP